MPTLEMVASSDIDTTDVVDFMEQQSKKHQVNESSSMNSVVNSNTNDKSYTVSPLWLFKYSKHLFDKYIKDGSELCVNVSSRTRADLTQTFRFSNEKNGLQFLISKLVPKNVCRLN